MKFKKKHFEKKAQVMTFLIVGMLLLAAFGFLYFLTTLKKDAEISSSQTDAINKIQSTTNEITFVLEECLKSSATDALYHAGLQSGYIYGNQYGFDSIPRSIPFEIDTVEKRIPYGLTRVDNEPSPPLYPIAHADGFRYTLGFIETNFGMQNVWGKNNMLKLCDRFGPNGPKDSEPASCEQFALGFGNNTVQNKLKFATLESTYACLAANKKFVDDKTRNFIIQNSDLEVLFTDSSVRFSLSLNATASLTGAEYNLNGVSYNAPVRLKRIYNLAYQIIQHDARDVKFNKELDYLNITSCNYDDRTQCWDPQLQVVIYRNVNPQFPGDSILHITDLGSTINGRPFVFTTAIENRPPMLEYYRENTTVSDRTIDLQRDVNDELLLLPQAFDPDEDVLQINYYGFKSKGLNASPIYLDVDVYGIECDGRQNWCAKYALSEFRPSIRELRMEVCDPSGLCDYQDIRLQIGTVDYSKLSFCPTWLAQTKPVQKYTCNLGEASCTCEQNQFCVFTNEPRPVVCTNTSLCCQIITDPNIVSSNLSCKGGSDCYQSVLFSEGIIHCAEGSDCFQETVSGTVTQNCAQGTTCYQEVVSGVGDSKCEGNCRQENDYGTITQECLGAGDTNVHDQGGTILTCTNT
jgi:hypothetical protein